MLTPTHLVTGQTAFLVGSIVTGHAPNLGEAGLAMAASLLPDLDSRQSYLGRLLPMVSEPLEHHFGHRTLTHSLLLQAGVGALAYAALPFGYALALISGRLSHSLADMMTPAGVCWLWPSRVRCVLPGNRKYRMTSMGRGRSKGSVSIDTAGLDDPTHCSLVNFRRDQRGQFRMALS